MLSYVLQAFFMMNLAGIGSMKNKNQAEKDYVVAVIMLFSISYNVSRPRHNERNLPCLLVQCADSCIVRRCFDTIPTWNRAAKCIDPREDPVNRHGMERHLGLCDQLCHPLHD